MGRAGLCIEQPELHRIEEDKLRAGHLSCRSCVAVLLLFWQRAAKASCTRLASAICVTWGPSRGLWERLDTSRQDDGLAQSAAHLGGARSSCCLRATPPDRIVATAKSLQPCVCACGKLASPNSRQHHCSASITFTNQEMGPR